MECFDGDSERSNDEFDISVDDERPTNDSDRLQSQHSRSGLNVLDIVDDGGDVTWMMHSNIVYLRSRYQIQDHF